MRKAKGEPIEMISAAKAAKLLDCTTQWLRDLAKKGYVPKATRGQYPMVATVQGNIRWLKEENARKSKSGAEGRVRDARAAEIERRMAREDREIVALDEAIGAFDDATGAYLQALSGLPARITRNQSERRRIEVVCDAERERLSARFEQVASTLRTGRQATDAGEEDDS